MADFAGTTGDDTQNGTSGDDTFDYTQGGEDTLNGKGGDDTFTMGSEFTATDQIDGGGGFDILILNGATDVNFLATTLTNVERIEMFGPSTYTLTLDDATVSAGKILEVFCGGGLAFDGSAETDGSFFIRTTGQVDVIRGGAGDDDINTDLGADTLYGGGGNDHLDSGHDSDADSIYGGDGNDTIIFERGDAVFGGAGADAATFNFGGAIAPLDGGAGIDTLDLSDGAIFGTAEFSASATGFEILTFGTIALRGDGNENVLDLSGFSGPTANQSLKIYCGGGGDTLIGNIERDIIRGGGGNNTLSGMDGNDKLTGGSKNDTLIGGAGKDHLDGKGGDNTYAYSAASDSTSDTRDVIVGFDSHKDSFDITSAVNAIDVTIASGALSRATFDADLSEAAGDAHLGAHGAVVFTPDAGNLSGHVFLIVDANATAGYQANADFVIELKDADLAGFDATNFI